MGMVYCGILWYVLHVWYLWYVWYSIYGMYGMVNQEKKGEHDKACEEWSIYVSIVPYHIPPPFLHIMPDRAPLRLMPRPPPAIRTACKPRRCSHRSSHTAPDAVKTASNRACFRII